MNNNSKLLIILAIIISITLFVMFDKVKLNFVEVNFDDLGFLILTVLGFNAGKKYGVKKQEIIDTKKSST